MLLLDRGLFYLICRVPIVKICYQSKAINPSCNIKLTSGYVEPAYDGFLDGKSHRRP